LVGTDPALEEVFRYADLVVEGVIEKISKVTATWKDIHPGLSEHEVPIAIMHFRIDTVLVGYQTARNIEIVAYDLTTSAPYHFDFIEGDRYILILRVPARGKIFEGGRFQAGSDAGKFLIQGLRWVQGERIKPMATGQLEELYDILENVRRDRSIERLTEQAKLIVRGKVLDVWESAEQTAEGYDKHITRVNLAVHSVMKGDIEGDSVVVSMISIGGYEPPWRTRVPDMHEGEEWIMFLKHADEPGYYLFAGVNGLFLVEGDDLYRNNNSRILLHFSPEDLEAQVNGALKGGE
ncbi:MAG TPA: hypothetical protein VMX58_07195, partial [Patescibacteria group bacterium]|nr:hypothetical protein [Patescibacteria group bacterium]